MPYQPKWVDGQDVGPADRLCAPRYEMIKTIVARYNRPATVLDLGCAGGYFGIRLAEEFGAVSVLMDRGDEHLWELARHELPTTIGLKREITEQDLEDLADCEHFDVVLALNILHHFNDPIRALRAVMRLGEQIVIETPPPIDTGACGQGRIAPLFNAVAAEAPYLLGMTPSHTTKNLGRPMFHFTRPKTGLVKPYMHSDRIGAPPMRRHTVVSSNDEKVFAMQSKRELRPWFPGINLWTWANLGGAWPPLEEVRYAVEHEFHRVLYGADEEVPTLNTCHTDVRPWNWIISGETVTLIDWNDPRQVATPDAEGLNLTLRWIGEPEMAWGKRRSA